MTTATQTIPGGYKQTEIGVIPADWDVKKLGDCLIMPPRYGIGAAAVEYSDRLPKYIRITDISEDGRFLPEKTVSVNNIFSVNYFLSEGDLVVARTGASVGKSYLYRPKDGPLVFAGFLICLIPNKNILTPEYLGAYLKTTSYWNWVKLTSMRSGQPGINGNEYARLLIPLPEIAEQIMINKVLSSADTLIEKLEKLVEKKKNIKQGAMQELLTGKRRLPRFSDKWEVKRLGDIFHVTRGQVLAMTKTTKERIGEYKYPVYSSQTKDNGLAGYYKDYLFENCITWTTDGANAGDVKYRAGKFYCTNVCGVLENNEGYSNLCIAAIFNSVSKKYVSYVGNPKLMNNIVADIKIVVPSSIEEQVAISTILSNMDTEIEKLESQLTKYQNLKQGMMQVLLTGKIKLLSK